MDKNNFDGVRIALALIVVFSHISVLTQLSNFKIFDSIFDSNFAVRGFFSISGFLVTKSYFTSGSILEYAEKRFRRIYPAYITAIALCLVIGLCTTTLNFSEFISSLQTLEFTISNLTFLNFIQPSLPGVFDNNPSQALDGALWTIKIEVMLYFCLPALLYLFVRFGSKQVTIATCLVSIAWVYFFTYVYKGSSGDVISRQFPGQLSYFVLGMLFATTENLLSKIRWIALGGVILIFATNNHLARLIINPIAYSSIVIFFATDAYRCLNLGKCGDISYGIYLYHFPIIQLLIYLGLFGMNAWLGLWSSLIFTIIAALVSWHLVEKRLLKRTSHYILTAKNKDLKIQPSIQPLSVA